ncbi:MAG: translocation/assembly module TamB domain-containing protein [Armatimonadota bacterium]|nr:translocation/assembly module TamB domain-containing protein [Armatimonadota bacterium]MDR7451367.1 translocation/assembly module TamB domain-containing protein [Armatimonadota bacterium]MDR7466483.1 translocation/assembly module TamB domain-containing protein [Armatimonadota bacterium]MDR7493205.1 translocation/assembly module TamB domain-containing protein [Armatimonadota bacterium]MDR7499442.1 translocation/assembly module TamB domain-containing protein [Armatimonadota bacterium]
MRRASIIVVIVALLAPLLAARGRTAFAAPLDWVRTRVVEEASRALGRDVEVEAISGDPVRGLVFSGVRVAGPPGRPGGPIFAAARITVTFDVPRLLRDLALRRGVSAGITSVVLERPLLAISRDARGRWNVEDLARRRGVVPAQIAFRGEVVFREGSVVFSDARRLPAPSAAPSSPFSAHFDRVTGALDFSRLPSLGFVLDAVNTDGRTPATLHAAGTVATGGRTLALDLTTGGASIDHWGPYLVPLPWLVWGGGTFDGTLHLLVSPWRRARALDYRGVIQVRDGRAVLLPRRTVLSAIDGRLAVDNLGVATEGMTMTVGGSPLSVRGTVTSVGGVAVDLALRSRALDLRTLQSLLFPRAGVRIAGRAGGEVRVVGPLDSPRVEGEVREASGSINGHPIRDASGRLTYYGGVVVFDHATAAAAGGRLQGHLRLDLDSRRFFLLGSARSVELGALVAAGGPLGPAPAGRVSGMVAAAGDAGSMVIQSRVTAGAGRLFGESFDGIEALIGYDRGRIEIDRFEARQGRSRLHLFGTAGRSGSLDLAVSGTDINLRRVGDRLTAPHPVTGIADVRAQIRGSLRSPVADGVLRARGGSLGPLTFDEVRGPFQVTRTDLSTTGLVLTEGKAHVTARGGLRWAPPGRMDLTLDAAGWPAARVVEIARLPLRAAGTVQGSLRLAGPLRNPKIEGTATLLGGQVAGQRIDRAEAAFRWTGTALDLEALHFRTNASTIGARGRVARNGRIDLTFAARDLDVTDIAAITSDAVAAAGHLDLSGTLSGTLRSPAVSATVASRDLALNGQRFPAAEGLIRYQQGRLTLAPLTLRQDDGAFTLSGTVPLRADASFDLDVAARQARLSTLLGLGRIRSPVAVQGTVSGRLRTSGTLTRPRALLDVTVSDAQLGDQPISEAVLRAELADGIVTLQDLRVRPERGELVGAGRIDLRGESEVEVGGTGLDLDLLRPLLNVRRPLGGTMDATVQLSGTLNDPVVGLSFSAQEGAVGAARFDRLILQAFYRGGQLHIENALLQEDRHKVRLTGTVPFNPARFRFDESRTMALHLDLVDSDLGAVGLLTDRVEEASGPLTGEVDITGTVARPQMRGTVATSGGTLKLRGVAPALEQVTGEVRLSEDTLHTGGVTARMGGGEVSLTGSAGIRNFRLDRLALDLRASGVRLEIPQLYAGLVDAGLRIGGTAAQPEIAGTATLSRGDLYVGSFAARTPDRNGRSGIDSRLNVELVAGDALWVNVGSLRLPAHGAVRAGGTWRAPRLAGEVTADRGTFVAFNHNFTLTEGRATFTEFQGVIPTIDARAETRATVIRPGAQSTRPEVVPVIIYLHVTGTPDNLTLALSSEPPLDRAEIVAALARQVGVTRLLAGESLETVLRAELSAALFGSVGRAVARALGLDEFTIEYATARPLTLRVGRLLIRDLYVTLTTEFTDQRRYIWGLEWRLTPITMFTLSVDNLGALEFLYRLTYRY